jgi:hypothetical protein
LESGRGYAVAGGALLPMAEVIRQASAAHHYLAVFDDHTDEAVYLGRAKRLASKGQQIVLYAKDRGCTKPRCPAPGYWCEAHHVQGWTAEDGPADIDTLTLACPPHNRLIDKTRWRTRKLIDAGVRGHYSRRSAPVRADVRAVHPGFTPAGRAAFARRSARPPERLVRPVRAGVAGRLGRNHDDGSANAPDHLPDALSMM